ncbi:hypothetical protein [Pseudomonas sp. 43NM1]|uniref:hypothetical protein n=1 Tax=Pseudomonas sp. 43NM1 TaxID=1904755 RepID=UPI0012FF23D3|nr:hypothetical protein [Pseudomonas sp. 43NM1]
MTDQACEMETPLVGDNESTASDVKISSTVVRVQQFDNDLTSTDDLARADQGIDWQTVSPLDFMSEAQRVDVLSGAGTIDVTLALQAFRDSIASSTIKRKGVIPAGTYRYAVSPNWAIQNASIKAEGEVRFRYTGTGDAIVLNADAADAVCFTPGLCYNVTMGPIIVEAPKTAGDAVSSVSLHHSKLNFIVHGCGSNSAGYRSRFGVLNQIDIKVTPNQEGWYLNAKPKYGVWLDRRNAAEETAYCTFNNATLEGVEVGAHLEHALGNMFLGGAQEGCSQAGLVVGAASRLNKFFNVDYEVNTVADIVCGGYENEFHGCDSELYTVIETTGKRNKFIGGVYQSFSVAQSATDNKLIGFDYNRFNTGGVLFDGGNRTRMASLTNSGSGLSHDYLPGSPYIIPTPASGAEYVNPTAHDITISVTGGSGVTYIGHNRGGGGSDVGFTSGQVTLSPNDGLTILYAGAPVLTAYKR